MVSHFRNFSSRRDEFIIIYMLFLAVLTLIPIFWFGIRGIVHEWLKPWNQIYSITPLICTVLLFRVFRSFPQSINPDWTNWLGVVGVFCSVVLALLGNQLRIDDFVTSAIVLWTIAITVTMFGIPGALHFRTPLVVMAITIPLPSVIKEAIIEFFQIIAVKLYTTICSAMGITVSMSGIMMNIDEHQIRVEELMFGLNGFFALIFLSILFAVLTPGPIWIRLLPLLLSLPVVIFWATVGALLISLSLVNGHVATGKGVLLMKNEWFFFGAIATSLAMLWKFYVSMFGDHYENIFRLRGRSLEWNWRVARQGAAATPQLIAATMLTVSLSTAYNAAPPRPLVMIERTPFSRFPPEVAGWSGSFNTISPNVSRILEADDSVLIDFYHNDEELPVNFWSAYYLSQDRDRGAIHSPTDCLPNGGWNILSFGSAALILPNSSFSDFKANRAVIAKGEARALVYYWFEGRGRRVANEFLARFLVRYDGFAKGRTDGALVRYVTRIDDDDEYAAEERIHRLIAATIDLLPIYIPE